MERSTTTGSSPARVTTRFEVAQVPSLSQLLAPALASGLLRTDPLQAQRTATGVSVAGWFSRHSTFGPTFGGGDDDLEDDPDMPPLGVRDVGSDSDGSMPPLIAQTTGRPVRSAARAARAAMTAAAAPPARAKPESTRKPRAKRRAGEASLAASPSPQKRTRAQLKKAPSNLKQDSTATETQSCAICMCEPSRDETSLIDGCSHVFCFGCIGKWSDTENTCPLCKSRFVKITRVHPQRKKKGGPSISNVKTVKHQDQRSDSVSGAALENLLASIAANGTLPAMGGSRLGYIFARAMGNHAGFAPAFGIHASTHFTTSFSLEDSLFESDDEEETFTGGVPGSLMGVLMRSTAIAAANRRRMQQAMHGGGGPPAGFAAAAAAAAPTRSYASNSAVRGAGEASNPLEIDDSDDDDVEVVRVSRRR